MKSIFFKTMGWKRDVASPSSSADIAPSIELRTLSRRPILLAGVIFAAQMLIITSVSFGGPSRPAITVALVLLFTTSCCSLALIFRIANTADRALRRAGDSDAIQKHCSSMDRLTVEEMRALHSELGQIRSITADAVFKLSQSFRAMTSHSASQSQIIRRLSQSLNSAGDEQHTDTTMTIHDFVHETTGLLAHLTKVMQQCERNSENAVESVHTMQQRIEEIHRSLSKIHEIERATRILSLNASIEAARAHSDGRSFGAVAQAIRELSERSTGFSTQIATVVEAAQKDIDHIRERMAASIEISRSTSAILDGKRRLDSMMSRLEELERMMASSVEDMNDLNEQISASTSVAISALQFEDLVRQLTEIAERKADRLADVARSSLKLLEGPSRSNDQNDRIAGMKTEIETFLAEAAHEVATCSVSQKTVRIGEVELF